MEYSFDSHGWLAPSKIQGRTTDVVPPTHGEKVVGQPYPNWTGHSWVMVTYTDPVIPTPPNPRKAEILNELALIDTQTTKPRTMRELQLGNQATIAWVTAKDAEAAALRAELASL